MSNIIRGNAALAKELGVSLSTVNKWRKNGILDDAVVVAYQRVILYDFDRAIRCLKAAASAVKPDGKKRILTLSNN